MVQALLEEVVLGPEEVWVREEVVAEAGWKVTDLVLAQVVSVSALPVELLFLMRQEYLAIK